MYEITRIRTITSKEAKQVEGNTATDDMRLAFELRFSRKMFDNYQQINAKFVDYTFIDTSLGELQNLVR